MISLRLDCDVVDWFRGQGTVYQTLSFRGQGIGELLLTDALKLSLSMSRKIASVAVIVDAKDETAQRFYTDFGFIAFVETARRLFLPMQTVARLFDSLPAKGMID